jgi:hypothetical protein
MAGPIQIPGRGDAKPNVISGNPSSPDPSDTGGRVEVNARGFNLSAALAAAVDREETKPGNELSNTLAFLIRRVDELSSDTSTLEQRVV